MSGQYADLRARLARALRSICPYDLADQVDDLAQAAVIRLMNRQRQSEGEWQVNSSYVRKVAYTVLVDEIRRHRRRREESVENSESTTPFKSIRPDPEQVVSGREIGRAIRRCLGELIESRRRAVTLYLQGHGVPEVARLLGWGVKKSENLVFRGMADLRYCLSMKGFQP